MRIENGSRLNPGPDHDLFKAAENLAQVERLGRIMSLMRESVEQQKVYSFPGMTLESLTKTREEEPELVELGLVAPIDEVLEECQQSGIQLVFGDDPNSGNVFVLPASRAIEDIEMFEILVQRLDIVDGMEADLRKLIELKRALPKRT